MYHGSSFLDSSALASLQSPCKAEDIPWPNLRKGSLAIHFVLERFERKQLSRHSGHQRHRLFFAKVKRQNLPSIQNKTLLDSSLSILDSYRLICPGPSDPKRLALKWHIVASSFPQAKVGFYLGKAWFFPGKPWFYLGKNIKNTSKPGEIRPTDRALCRWVTQPSKRRRPRGMG